MRRGTALELAAVAFAAALFFWMYLATAGLERAAEAGAFGTPGPELIVEAREYGYEWRHGQAGWPIYVPGFFVAAFTAAPLCRRAPRHAVGVLIAGTAMGWLLTIPFAGAGAELVADSFAARTGWPRSGNVEPASAISAYPAAATLIAWSLVVLGLCVMVRSGRWKLLASACVAYALVAGIRGTFAFGELTSVWFERAVDGDSTALFSIAAAAASAVTIGFLVRFGPPSLKRRESQQPGMELPTA